jgi:hypothetical protein
LPQRVDPARLLMSVFEHVGQVVFMISTIPRPASMILSDVHPDDALVLQNGADWCRNAGGDMPIPPSLHGRA